MYIEVVVWLLDDDRYTMDSFELFTTFLFCGGFYDFIKYHPFLSRSFCTAVENT